MLRRRAHLLPPHIAIVGQRDVGIDAVGGERLHGVGVGIVRGAGRHAEEAGLRIDGVKPPILAELHPANVVADGLGLPAGNGRVDHGEIGLAAGAREGRGDEFRFSFRIGELEDQHVLGHPALVARLHRGDAERMAFLAEQCVAAIARAVRPDLARLWKVRDVFGLIARPRDIGGRRRGKRIAHRVHAAHEILAVAERLPHLVADAGHDVHVGDGVGGVRDHHADTGDRRADRPHGIGHHIHGAPGHRPVVKLAERFLHRFGVEPVVGRARVVLLLGADVSLVLDSRDVLGVGAHQDRVRPLFGVEPQRRAAIDQRLEHTLVFVLGAVAPHDVLGLEQRFRLFDEGEHFRIGGLGASGHNLRLNAHAAGSPACKVGLDGKKLPLASTVLAMLSRRPLSTAVPNPAYCRPARASAASLTSSLRASAGVVIGWANSTRRPAPSSTMSKPSGSMPTMRQAPGEASARAVA